MMVLDLLIELPGLLIPGLIYLLAIYFVLFLWYKIKLKDKVSISKKTLFYSSIFMLIFYIIIIDIIVLLTGGGGNYESSFNPFYNILSAPVYLLVIYFITYFYSASVIKSDLYWHKYTVMLIVASLLPMIPLFFFIAVLFAGLSS